MSSPSQEHLLGYALGALEPWEQEQVERELAESPELQRQLARLRARLEPLECARHVSPPPEGLARCTCSYVFEHLPQEELVTPAHSGLAAAMRAEPPAPSRSRWTLADMVVAAGIFLAAGMLFFPAIAHSRYQAQLAHCQNNLRMLGQALIDFSTHDPQYEFPPLPIEGNRAAAGIQAAMIYQAGYLDRPSVVICPASSLAQRLDEWEMPPLDLIDKSAGEQLAELQRRAGGSLAFTLGYPENDGYTHVRNKARFNYALASDAPSGLMPNLVSSHHDGQGQNVLFECGRVAYIRGCGTEACGDSLFWNRAHRIEAGLTRDDNVLAVSGTPPLVNLSRYLDVPGSK